MNSPIQTVGIDSARNGVRGGGDEMGRRSRSRKRHVNIPILGLLVVLCILVLIQILQSTASSGTLAFVMMPLSLRMDETLLQHPKIYIKTSLTKTTTLNTALAANTSHVTATTSSSTSTKSEVIDINGNSHNLNGSGANNKQRTTMMNEERSEAAVTNFHPSLPWPQFDNRIQDSIHNGIRIIPSLVSEGTATVSLRRRGKRSVNKTVYYISNSSSMFESPPPNLATVVTAYYDMPSKHGFLEYSHWFDNMLSATDPMIIFIDPDRIYHINWTEFVITRRQHAPTIVALMPLQNFVTRTTFHESFWKLQTPSKSIRPSPFSLYNEKMIWMREVALLNPFQTELFAWIDAGYFRGNRQERLRNQPIVRNNITQNGVPPNQILFQNVFQHPWDQEIAAGAFGGRRDAILQAYDKYWLSFWDMVRKGLKVGYEQRVMVTMCRSWPELCSVQYSGQDKNWVQMGTKWLRQPHHNFSTTTMLLSSSTNETLLPTTIVQEDYSKIEFPKVCQVITAQMVKEVVVMTAAQR